MTKNLYIADKVIISRKNLKDKYGYDIKPKKRQKNNSENKNEIIAKIVVDILNSKEFSK